MSIQGFAHALVAQYPNNSLEGSTIWLLVCSIGKKMDELLTALATTGLKNVTVYAPVRLTFISDNGMCISTKTATQAQLTSRLLHIPSGG